MPGLGEREFPINLRCETCRAGVHTTEPEVAFEWVERHLHLTDPPKESHGPPEEG